jgi:pimeloyl-ACP methyl ester carboxylesterase
LLDVRHEVNPEQALHDYASRALAASDAFYAHEPAERYEFDGHILKFPSGIETPYAVNNVVWGRYFGASKDLATIVVPHWNCKWDALTGLCRMLQRCGVSALRLSLPYHHHRMPAELERAEYLVSPNVGRTLTANRQAVVDVRQAADWLFAQGHRRVALAGLSIGSCIAFLTFAHDRRFCSGVFVHSSGYFADVVWSGLSTKHVRRALDGFVDLELLRRLWAPISPLPYIEKLRGDQRAMLVLSGEYDLSFPSELTRQAHAELARCEIPARIQWLPCGHYTMGEFPFNVLVGFQVVRFLVEQLQKG